MAVRVRVAWLVQEGTCEGEVEAPGRCVEAMNLPIEEHQVLLCGHEDCELWQVLSAVVEVVDSNHLETARSLLANYVRKGWIALARVLPQPDPNMPPAVEALSQESTLQIIANDDNWLLLEERPPRKKLSPI
jgi:hypothetical protein